MNENEPRFKKGDWCFCEFVLQQIKETEEDRITSVTDGAFNLSSDDLSDVCYPMDLSVKRISDGVDYWSKKFHATNHNGLNYPDLNRALIIKWCEMCNARFDEKKLTELWEKLNKFGQEIIDKVENLQYDKVDGVRVFGR